MENTSKTYAYGRVATADQLHPERKQQLGTVCLLQKMGYTVALAPITSLVMNANLLFYRSLLIWKRNILSSRML